jgi:coenzyme F420 hydrogenase subunit beta
MSKRLETEVWALDNCAGCGLCVAACSKQVLRWTDLEHPVREQRIKTVGYSRTTLDSCTFCEKLCEAVCPRLKSWTPQEARVTLAARALGPVLSGTPNAVIQSILAAGRTARLLDGVVTLDLNPWDLTPHSRVAATVEEIVDSPGPQYLWAPTLDALNEAIFIRGMENLAIVGPPCVAQAIRQLKRAPDPLLLRYQQAIRLNVAVFCSGMYLPSLVEDVVEKRLGVAREWIKRVEISADGDSLRIVLWDNSVREISRQYAEHYTRRGCNSCQDYLGESADLAVGALGTEADSATLIIRSRVGDLFTRNAVRMKLLNTSDAVDHATLAAAREDKAGRERAQAFKDLQVLMLDALSDPNTRNEAIQKFAHVYRTPVRSKSQEVVRNNCTGC